MEKPKPKLKNIKAICYKQVALTETAGRGPLLHKVVKNATFTFPEELSLGKNTCQLTGIDESNNCPITIAMPVMVRWGKPTRFMAWAPLHVTSGMSAKCGSSIRVPMCTQKS